MNQYYHNKFFKSVNPPVTSGHFNDVVMIDNDEATCKGTKYLLDLGHKRIGFVNGPAGIRIFDKRLQGYKKALQENGIELDESLIVEGEQSSKTAESAVRQFLAQALPPTAIFTTSDLVAIAVLRTVQKSGLKVPEDISVMGFDDIPVASLIFRLNQTLTRKKAKKLPKI